MRSLLLALTIALAGCRNEAPPAPTEQQSAQLNEADAMLNQLAQNQEGPETNAPSPSN